MISQRPASAAPAVQGLAEALPVADKSFDAAMAVLTIHHWSDWRRGLADMRRVARDRVVLLTIDTEAAHFWLSDYFPKILALDRRIMPRLEAMADALGPADIQTVPVPHDCIDGFLGAYWRRPQVYLDPIARQSMSSFARIDASAGLARLAADLASGAWQARNADLLSLDTLDLGYRLLTWRL
jgi:SAM-dependent methyltransferase